jgi:hypothetical protein
MAIMGHARRKGRSIVEGVRLLAFRLSCLCQSFLLRAHPDSCTRKAKAFAYQLNLRQKSVDLVPALEDALLFLGEINRHG